MLFNTLTFLYFFAAAFTLHSLFAKQVTIQNLVLLIASYFFYGYMHWAFPMYLFGLTTVAFFGAKWLQGAQSVKTKKVGFSIIILLLSASLLILKYTNFAIEIINTLSDKSSIATIKFLVPVGISFYTFTLIGYVSDVYLAKKDAENNPLTFYTYIAFFPHLLIGPIGKSIKVLPQFSERRNLSLTNLQHGAELFIWGLFKKMVIADNIVLASDYCFANYANLQGYTLLLGAFIFWVHLYADFSSYIDMALGIAKAFGIQLEQNFRFPFFAANLQDFWQRWHISLNAWFRDYIYIPLGGNRLGILRQMIHVIIIFLISGLWHGANITFIVWGALHGIYITAEILIKKYIVKVKQPLFSIVRIPLLLLFITTAWVFFRAENIHIAVTYVKNMYHFAGSQLPPSFITANLKWISLLFGFEIFYLIFNRKITTTQLRFITHTVGCIVLILLIIFFHKQYSAQEYYYFKF